MKSKIFKEKLIEFKDRLLILFISIFLLKYFFDRLKPISTMSTFQITVLLAGLMGIVYWIILLTLSFISIIKLIIIKIFKIMKKRIWKL